jgi:hypothetical protein
MVGFHLLSVHSVGKFSITLCVTLDSTEIKLNSNMGLRLRETRILGRYKNAVTGKEYNIQKGTRVGRGTDVYYYLYRGKRQFISAEEYFKNHTKIE